MTTTWATCAACTQPLYPHTARRTDDGWAHSVCRIPTVPIMRCDRCHHAATPTPDGLCDRCAKADDIALTDGAWVRSGLIRRWQAAG
jgi:hypothetical protein